MNLPRLILKKLREEHMGRSFAIKREHLLSWLQGQGATIDDRAMRAVVKTMPIICSCESGYFVAHPTNGYDDVEYSIQYLKKKAMPLLVDIRRKKQAYPQFYTGEQLELEI